MALVTGGGSGTNTATVHVSSAEILALNSSPKTMVAAPGANKMLWPLDVVCVYNFLTSDYTFTSRVDWTFANTTVPSPTSLSNDHFGQAFGAFAASQVFYMNFNSDFAFWNTQVPRSYVENQALHLFAVSADPTGGLGSFDFTITYRVVTLP